MNLSPSIESSLHKGLAYAVQHRHGVLTLEHFLWGALHSPELKGLLDAFKVSPIHLQGALEHTMQEQDETLNEDIPSQSHALIRALRNSARMAEGSNSNTITMWMVLLCLLQEPDSYAAYHLQQAGITSFKIKSYASHGQRVAQDDGREGVSLGAEESAPNESALALFAVNLNQRAEENKIDPLIGRAYEVERTAQILSRRRKNNPLLVGEPGVGKTAIAEGLAKLIVEGKVPEALLGKTVMSLNVGTMLAGTKFRGDFEQRVQNVLDEVKKDPNIILFIDEIHTLIGAGSASGNAMDASNLIKPALASGDLRVIGATTFQEYREIFEKEKALDRRFQKVDVVEPTSEETVDILKGLKKTLEEHHGVKYTTDALQSAVDLSVKYMTDRFLPDKAIDVLDEAGAAERLKPSKQRHKFIDKMLIEQTIAKITRLPVAQVSQDEKNGLEHLSDELKGNVFGQEQAIETLSTAVCISKAGLNDGDKPLGSFLFAGPTGVGKTEIVRQLSKSLGIPLLRFDMSEYMESHSVARLIGSPPGYVGHDKGGLLTDAVFKSPHSVLLLDEIEKAHPDILNLLLQVMDRGALTDSNGRTVNFKNTFVIMTTNAGAQAAQKASMGFVKADHSSDGKQVINTSFAPEFRNRLDAIVLFKALGEPEIAKIVDKNIRLLAAPLKEKGVSLEVSEAVRSQMATEGFDQLMGARPMARVISDKLKKPLAQMILFGDLKNGGVASVDKGEDGEWVWTSIPAVASVEAEPQPVVVKKQPKKASKKAPSPA